MKGAGREDTRPLPSPRTPRVLPRDGKSACVAGDTPEPQFFRMEGFWGADPFLAQALPSPLQASPSMVPAAGARPRQRWHLPSPSPSGLRDKERLPAPHPLPRKSRSSTVDLQSPACPTHTAPHGPQTLAGPTLPLTSKIKIKKSPPRDKCSLLFLIVVAPRSALRSNYSGLMIIIKSNRI